MGSGKILRRTPPWVRDQLYLKAGQLPAVDWRFAQDRSLVDRISGLALTFTRTTGRTFDDADGSNGSVGVNVPAFSYSGGASRGLDVWEARTNSILSSSMTGGATGTPGTYPTGLSTSVIASGLTLQIAALGTDAGLAYVDVRISGTTADSNGFRMNLCPSAEVVAASGQTWTGSCYCSAIAGSYSNITNPRLRIVERTAGGGYLTEEAGAVFTTTGALTAQSRATVTRTLTDATTGRVQLLFSCAIANGVAVDFTLRIGGPQLELGANASPYIATDGSTVQRTADVCSTTDLSWYNPAGGVFYVEAIAGLVSSGGFPRTFNLSNVTGSEQIRLQRYSTGIVRGTIITGAVVQVGLDSATVAEGAVVKAAMRVTLNDIGISANGASEAVDLSATLPSVTQLQVGQSYEGSHFINSTISRLCYFPPGPAANRLQRLTA